MTTATVEKADYGTLVSKKVTIVRNLKTANEKGETAEEVEGTVQAANEMGILIKPKGKTNFHLIEMSEIEDVFLTPEGDKKFTRSKLKMVEPGKMRRHLLDRHGLTLKWCNEASEEDAVKYHDSLNHEELDLGHVHVAKEEKADDATEAAVEES
jgi:hypothetical protein